MCQRTMNEENIVSIIRRRISSSSSSVNICIHMHISGCVCEPGALANKTANIRVDQHFFDRPTSVLLGTVRDDDTRQRILSLYRRSIAEDDDDDDNDQDHRSFLIIINGNQRAILYA